MLATLACTVVAVTARADWPQYPGPNRNAVALDAELAIELKRQLELYHFSVSWFSTLGAFKKAFKVSA